MMRYLHLYITYLILNFKNLVTYRANFVNSTISSVGWGIVSLVSMFILTAKNSSIYDWNRNELLLLTGVYSISVGIFHTVFSRNFDRFSKIIHMGELDSILLKPIDSQFSLTFTIFNFLSITRFFIGFLFVIYMFFLMHLPFSFLLLIEFTVFTFFGIALLYAIWFSIITLTVWLTNLDNLKEFLYQINNLGRYPSEILYQTGNAFLFLLLPLTYVASIPTRTLISKPSLIDSMLMIMFALLLLLFSRFFWKFALRFYASANI